MATTTKKKRRKKSVKKLKYSNKNLNFVHIATLAGIILILLVVILAARACGGISHRTPKGVVEGYIKAAVAGKDKKMQECYSADKVSDEAKTEISSTVKYFQAHEAKAVNIESCETISENKKYSYVYIRYNLVLQNDQEYPCIGTYLVKAQDKKYYLYSPSDISDKISQQAAADYQKFMTTKTYTDYTKAYEVFLKKNPGYEDKIASKLNG